MSSKQLSSGVNAKFHAERSSDQVHCRVMKARKALKSQELIQQVIAQISPRFALKIPDMNKASVSIMFPSWNQYVLPTGY